MNEACVWIHLAASGAPVLAGRFRHDADAAQGEFAYDAAYLARPDAVELDPVELPLSDAPFETDRLGGVLGALGDAGPDHWGRSLLDAQASSGALDELGYLLAAPDDHAGALSFGGSAPATSRNSASRTLANLPAVHAAADAFMVEGMLGPEGRLLLQTGLGGGRPKLTLEDGGALWVAKLNRADDPWNVALVEHATLTLARRCGVDAAVTKVVNVDGRDVLLVRRFDREKAVESYRRARMASGLTLLRSDEGMWATRDWSYVALADVLGRVSERPDEDRAELFRRMAFNALVSNLDDHPRNHAIISRAGNRGWRLSPAYDVTPTPAISEDRRDLAMACGAEGRRASAGNLLSECGRFGISRDEADAFLDGMEDTVRHGWRRVMAECGVTDADCGRVARAFAYPGFRY